MGLLFISIVTPFQIIYKSQICLQKPNMLWQTSESIQVKSVRTKDQISKRESEEETNSFSMDGTIQIVQHSDPKSERS